MNTSEFDDLIADALLQPFEGWDFSWLRGRATADFPGLDPPPNFPSWNYEAMARSVLAEAGSFVDLGTGGGEVLSRLGPFPRLAIATEAYLANVPPAARQLRPLGVHVVAVDGAPDNHEQQGRPVVHLPFRDASLDLVIDRHESFWASEVRRVLRPGGTFITQQVGPLDQYELVSALEPDWQPGGPDLELFVEQCRGAGLRVVEAREEFGAEQFRDVGAVVYLLRVVPWIVPGFSVEKHWDRLLAMHERIKRAGLFRARSHRILIACERPADL